jgi:hypothetical protein
VLLRLPEGCVARVPASTIGAVDWSGSMIIDTRCASAQRCMAAIQAASSDTVFHGFGITTGRVDDVDAFAVKTEGTTLMAAAKALIDADVSGPDSNIVIITDCESVKDHAVAYAAICDRIHFTDRRVLLIGVGDRHVIHDLQSLIPAACAGQIFYLHIPEGSENAPTQCIRDILQSTHVNIRGDVTFLLPGASVLLPIGADIADVRIDKKALSDLTHVLLVGGADNDIDIDCIVKAVCDTITRQYNAVLATVRREGMRDTEAILTPVRALAAAELRSIETMYAMEAQVLHAAELYADGNTCSTAQRHALQYIRRAPGTESVLQRLRDLKALVDGHGRVHMMRHAMLAARLLDRSSRGSGGGDVVAAKPSRSVDLYSSTHHALATLETTDAAVNVTADTLDSVFPRGTFACVVTGACKENSCCLVAMGQVNRKQTLVGAVIPLVTTSFDVSTAPYDFRAAYTCFQSGKQHAFGSDIGDVNGIVGVFPGNSRAACAALPAILSEIGTGRWDSPLEGLKPMLALLIGVEHVLQTPPVNCHFARVLAIGWAGAAARTQTPEPGTSMLTAAYRLLRSAMHKPFDMLGLTYMRSSLWSALLFTMQCTHDVLVGKEFALPDTSDFRKMLDVEGIAVAARLALKTRLTIASTYVTFRKTLHQRVGVNPLFVDDVRCLHMTPRLRGAPTDFGAESETEAAFLDAGLAISPRIRPNVRAAFWTAIEHGGAFVPAVLTAFDAPQQWVRAMEEAELRDRREALEAEIREATERCRRAYWSSLQTLPVMFPGRTSVTLRRCNGVVEYLPVTIASWVSPTLCKNHPTMLLKNVCCAMDHPDFMTHDSERYMRDVLGGAAQPLPRFHATMTGWYVHGGLSADTLLGYARQAWPTAPLDAVTDAVSQWLLVNTAHKYIVANPHVRDGKAVCVALGHDPHAPAACWEEADEEMRRVMYGDREEWSYARAVVEFLLAAGERDDVFDAQAFQRELVAHRCFTVPFKTYMTRLGHTEIMTTHAEVAKRVYAEMACRVRDERIACLA